MKKILYIIALAITLASCTKEIELDYNDIDPIPVIEGHLSPEGAEVKITKTRNMSDSTKTPGMRVESVRIVSPDGTETALEYQSDGIYRPEAQIALTDGETYTLKVVMDGVEYSGSSTLLPTIHISEPQFVWAELMDWMQVLEFETLDIPEHGETYGWARIYRNGEIYFSDCGKCKGNSPFDIGLYYDSDMEQDDEMILYDGDKLFLEFRVIDENVFNYLYGYNSTKMNPPQFFSTSVEGKECLGYFAAFNRVTYETIYEKTEHVYPNY